MRTNVSLLIAVYFLTLTTPASAQFYIKEYDYAGDPVSGIEPDIMQQLPGASDAEMAAGMVWTLRAALNVAALQCQFEPMLLTQGTYNALLVDHGEELKSSWLALDRYFTRQNKTTRAGQNALDQYGTRTYSSFATVASQLGFCRTAAAVGRDVIFSPRGSLATIARMRLRELRNSLTPYGEQQFPRYLQPSPAPLPKFDQVCWNRKGEWQTRKCGSSTLSIGTSLAAR